MTPAELRALAKRVCEEAPSRELEFAIAYALHVPKKWPEWSTPCFPAFMPGSQFDEAVPPWLHSLDAAASLMPEGWGGSVDWGNAGVKGYMALAVRDTGERQSFTVFAPTEPQSRVAAALLARAADMEASDAG